MIICRDFKDDDERYYRISIIYTSKSPVSKWLSGAGAGAGGGGVGAVSTGVIERSFEGEASSSSVGKF